MTITGSTNAIDFNEAAQPLIDQQNFGAISELFASVNAEQTSQVLERLGPRPRAVVYRLLPKDRAVEVFELSSPGLQSDLIQGLQDA